MSMRASRRRGDDPNPASALPIHPSPWALGRDMAPASPQGLSLKLPVNNPDAKEDVEEFGSDRMLAIRATGWLLFLMV